MVRGRKPCTAKAVAVTTTTSTTAGTMWARKASPMAPPMSTASRRRPPATRAWISRMARKKKACAKPGAKSQGE